MTQIVPTITAESPEIFAREIAKLNFARRIHIDISDGNFAPSKTVNLNQIYWDDGKNIDLHLMMNEPQNFLHQIVALNPNLAIFHAEIPNAKEILPKIREHLRKFGIEFGVAILSKTLPENVREIISQADYVLIFGGKLGFQGGIADLINLKKAGKIREINLRVEIAWDGGANAKNVAEIAKFCDVINAGSAIAKSKNPEKTYAELLKLAQNAAA